MLTDDNCKQPRCARLNSKRDVPPRLVKFMFGGNEVQATVIEDRGPVGA